MRPLNKIMLSSASAMAMAFVATPALAQTPEPVNPDRDPCQAPAEQRAPGVECPPADSPAGEAVQQGAQVTPPGDDAIVVVGSRIRRDRFNTADPVTVLTRDAAVDAGFTSTAEVLQSVAVTGGTPQINDTFGGYVVEGGPGVNTLSLRGLGATRTLILLNGRRIAPAGTRGQVGAADLNVLPNAILDRIEVLNTGASSIYGSDAVAGVVNIVTRTRFDGLTIEGSITAPEIGAGTSKRLSVVAGTSGERFSILGSLEMFDRNRITIGDNPWFTCPQQLRLRDGSDFDNNTSDRCFPLQEGGVTVNTIATGFYFGGPGSGIDLAPGFESMPPGYYLYCNRFRPDPTVTTGPTPGFECVGGLAYNPDADPTTPGRQPDGFGTNLNVRDTFHPDMLKNDVISPTRNYTGYISGTYDTGLLGDGQLYAELLVSRRKSQQNGTRQFYIDYDPVRNTNGALVRNPLIRLGLGFDPRLTGNRVRAFTNYGIYDSRQTQDFVKANVGLRGDLPFLPTWRYDAYLAKSWADGSYTFEQILSDRLAQSLDVVAVNSAGTIVAFGSGANTLPAGATLRCRVTTGGCVPAPPLTPGIIAGNYRQLAPAWFDFITDDVTGTTKFREWTANMTVDGPLFRLPGGDAQLALGMEYRNSSINDVPPSDSQRGNLYGFTSAPITKGSDSVWEAFGEIELPILRNAPFAEALTVNASARYTDYKSYGSDKTYKIGALYSPTRWLSFRGSYGTSYRAPALYEQFLGSTTGFLAGTTDPCNNLFDVTDPNTRTNCLADGLPPNFIQNGSVTVIQRGGAEAGLEAETSKNLTLGGVLQPTFGPDFGNLSLAVDYFDIEVNNGVSQLGAGTIARGCYNGTRPEYCAFVTRAPYTGPGTGALSVTQTYINVATDKVKGIDFVLNYDRRLGPGRLDMGVQAVHILDRVNQTNPDSAALDFVGFIGQPKWAGTGHVAYGWGPWYLRWGVDYIQGTSDNDYLVDFGYPADLFDYTLPDYWLHTVSGRFEIDRYTFVAGVRNVFDKRPPRISAEDPLVNTTSNVPLQSGFDMRGRTFFVTARAKIF